MVNREKIQKVETLHLYIALRRNKENKERRNEICIREIDRGISSIEILKQKTLKYHGVWRIYKTVNSRDPIKAQKLLMKQIIDNPENAYKLESVWKTCLLQPKCRAENNFMWDVDLNIEIEELKKYFKERGAFIKEIVKSPNGYNVVTEKCDVRKFTDDWCKYYRDRYVFVERYIVGENNENDITE